MMQLFIVALFIAVVALATVIPSDVSDTDMVVETYHESMEHWNTPVDDDDGKTKRRTQ